MQDKTSDWIIKHNFILGCIFGFFSAVPGDKVMRDIRPGVPFEPTYIYRLLTVSKSTLSEKVKNDPRCPFPPPHHSIEILTICHVMRLPFQGRQEDAEEYLGFVLNGLHEEMLSLKKLLYLQNDSTLISYKLLCGSVMKPLLGQEIPGLPVSPRRSPSVNQH